MRICSSCLLEKDLSEFYKGICWKGGYDLYCKECSRSKRRESWNNPKGKERHARISPNGDVWCPKCKSYKDRSEFYTKLISDKITYSSWCKSCDKENQSSRRKSPEYRVLRARIDHERRQLVKNSENSLTSSDIILLLKLQKESCANCKRSFSKELKYEIDHILPVSRGGGLTIDNVQLLCKSCNCSKKDKTIKYRNDFSLI